MECSTCGEAAYSIPQGNVCQGCGRWTHACKCYRNGSEVTSTNPCAEIVLKPLTETEKYDQGNQRREAIMAQRLLRRAHNEE